MLTIRSTPISSNLCSSLLDHLSYKEATHYWIQKEQLLPQTVTHIDWALLGSALCSCPPTYSMWLSKFASGHSTIGTTMAQWKKWDTLCQTTDETTCHVLQCWDPAQTSKWKQTIDKLQSWLVQMDTNPNIIYCLTHTLHHRRTSPFTGAARGSCCAAAHDQDLIGFFGTMVGHLSPLWESSQASYWHEHHSSKSPKHCTCQLCQCLLHATHASWLLRNQQIQSHLLATQMQDVLTAICRAFKLGHQNSLPADHFYLSREPDSEGFSLHQVLDFPLPNQQLWLHAVQQAHTRGSRVLALDMAQMQSSLYTCSIPVTPATPNPFIVICLHFGFAPLGGHPHCSVSLSLA